MFSIPFEILDPLSTGHTFTLSRLIGLLMICVALTRPKLCFAPPPLPFWLFATYLLLVALMGLTEPSGYWEVVRPQLFSLVQLVVLFWIAINLLRYPRTARSAIFALGAATLTVAILSLAGIGLSTIPDTGRVSMFGEDPNTVAGMLSLGILAWIGLGREMNRRGLRGAKYWPVPSALIGLAVIRTGSRGGVLALLCGILALLLEKREGGPRRRSRLTVITVAGAVVLGLLASATNVLRWEATFSEGKLAGREQIFPAAWAMFLERPILGWGPGRHIEELATRTGRVTSSKSGQTTTRDTHNGLLWVLTEVGLVGAIPYLLALWLCLRAAWRGRAQQFGVLPLAMTICVLAINMSVTWQNRKFYWLILGLAVASSRIIEAKRQPRRAAGKAVMVLPQGARQVG